MELTNAVSQTVLESVKKHAREFVGDDKEQIKFTDIAREIDSRMKKGVAKLRGKEDYEIGDLVAYVTEKSISYAEKATGTKLDTATEISKSIDQKVKTTVASYVGEENYKSGALAEAVATKVKSRAIEIADVGNAGEYDYWRLTLLLCRLNTYDSATSLIKYLLCCWKSAKCGHRNIWEMSLWTILVGRISR